MSTNTTTSATVDRVDGGGGGYCAVCRGHLDYSWVAYASDGRVATVCSLHCPGVGAPFPITGHGLVRCDYCDHDHEAQYDHEGRYGEGPIYAVVCPDPIANRLGVVDYYTRERVTA